MTTKARSVEQMVEQQMTKWQMERKKHDIPEYKRPMVVTISREPGSGGRIIAEKIAERLGWDLFYQEVLNEMAKSAKVTTTFMDTLDEKGLNTLDEWISSLVHERHLWPDQYLQHLMKVIGTIGRHGRAVVIGRGSNFIIPQELRVSIRVIAPLDARVKQIAKAFNLPKDEAERRAIHTESNRKAAIRKYFNADIADPLNYDLTANTGMLSLDQVVDIVCAAVHKD
jgi:cytidylate kinase